MEYKALNTFNLIIGKFGTLINRFISFKEDVNVKGYKFVKDVTPIYSKESGRGGIYKRSLKGNLQDELTRFSYKDNKDDLVVIKTHKFFIPDLDFFHINNEALVLDSLKKQKIHPEIYPKPVGFSKMNGRISLATKFIRSESLAKENSKNKVIVIKSILNVLDKISGKLITKQDLGIAKRTPYALIFNLPILLIQLVFKKPQNLKMYFKHVYLFYVNFLLGYIKGFELGFVHRDLYPDNIAITKDKKIISFDWENALISDPLNDLAQVCLIYWKDFGRSPLMDLLNEKLEYNSQRRRFISLSIYYSFQALANTALSHPHYGETEKFLDILIMEIYPKLIKKKSPFEIIYSITLDLIYLFYKLSRLSSVSKNKKLVLCFHSVGNSHWRFATSINSFKRQIGFLMKHYKIKPISKLLSGNTAGVSITFDDGYKDVYENALPILKKHKLSATMFILGDTKYANRRELDNNLPLLSLDEVKKLKRFGWTIGYHSKTHANLDKIDDKKLYEEIVAGKIKLEKNIGFGVKYFAYPKGYYSDRVIKFIKQAKFSGAFTVDGENLSLKNKMLLDRIPMEGELSINQLEALLSPLGLFTTNIFMKILKVKEKAQNNATNWLKHLTFSQKYTYAK